MITYSYNKNLNCSITFNFPEEKVVEMKDLNYEYKRKSYNSDRYRFYITKENLALVKDKIMWTTENYENDVDYGTLFMRTEEDGRVIPVHICRNTDDEFDLFPIERILEKINIWVAWPSRSVKVFETYEEFIADKRKKEKKRLSNLKQHIEAVDTVGKTNPEFSLKTPELKIIKVLKKTDKLKAKVGDIIQGELPVLKRNDKGFVTGCLYGGMSYSNYITCYVNGELIKSLSPLHFQQIFEENYVVETVE